MEHYHLYHHEIPAFLTAFAQTPAITRLRQIGMNCGCEYTSFPLFRGLLPYSRLDHSLGVALIVWHFSHSKKQTLAGLLHDVATPVFSHSVDFMNGDYLTQESTEADTKEIIADSPELQTLLRENDLATQDVCDYHRFPLADNDAPRLSADRLEYTLGNVLNFGICPPETVRAFYGDLTVGMNEDGQDELAFRTRRTAEDFSLAALKCSGIYVCDEDRYAMQILSEILRHALEHGVITPGDLHTTEPAVIEKLLRDSRTAALWKRFRSLTRIIRADAAGVSGQWRNIQAKKRAIDPLVQNEGRVSNLSPAFRSTLDGFLGADQHYWICGGGNEK
ncbi:MAG: HD domain-containing protein [Oscillospiraceae bacterium]|nr:HD domain-containing protein [Oscillospiraceae bacterium]